MKKLLSILSILIITVFTPAKNSVHIIDVERPIALLSLQAPDSVTIDKVEADLLVPFGLYQSFGLSYNHINQPNFTGNRITLSYAINPWGGLSFGGEVGYLNYNYNSDDLYHRVPLNLGVTYRLSGSVPALGVHRFGISIENLTGIEADMREQLTPPRSLTADWRGEFLQGSVTVSGEVGSSLDSTSLLYGAQLTLRPGIFEVGSRISHNEWIAFGGIYPRVGERFSVRVGAGLYEFEDAFVRGEVGVAFGKDREGAYGTKMSRGCCISVGILYNKMRSLHYEGNYYDAAVIAGRVLTEERRFFKNDYVSYYLLECLERLTFYESCRIEISEALKTYRDTTVISLTNLTLLKLYLHENSPEILTIFDKIKTSSLADSIKEESIYTVSEYYLRNGYYKESIDILANIPPKSYYYSKVQTSIAIAEYLDRSTDSYSIKDSLFLKKYTTSRKAYETVGQKFAILIRENQNSHIIEQIDNLKAQIEPYQQIIAQYSQVWIDERARLLKLATGE